MKVLVVGGGGREHALAWALARSEAVSEVIVAPGNPGTAAEAGVRNAAVAADDLAGLLALARAEAVGLTVVGPEAPLVAGIVDRFGAAGLACFGPSRAAAQLEGSKAFTKAFLARHGIPTAGYRVFGGDQLDDALAYLRERGAPIVVKADGLAAGKGVVVARSLDVAEAAVRAALEGGAFGEAGSRVVIEDFLEGEEASFIVLTDGETILPFATSQDHKARDDGDCGPNTGGMGAYSPAPVVTDDVAERIMRRIVAPTVAGMRAEGSPYRGFLYAGVMIDAAGDPWVVEFNCRFGDPEAQPVLLRLRSDLAALCLASVSGALAEQPPLLWDPRVALGVVLAAPGYPEAYRKDLPLDVVDARADGGTCKLFHAGTRRDDRGALLSSGGRVLCVTALGDSTASAAAAAYAEVDALAATGLFCRRDIGFRAIARERR